MPLGQLGTDGVLSRSLVVEIAVPTREMLLGAVGRVAVRLPARAPT